MDDNYYMKIALDLAYEAYSNGEVPVGAVIVKDNKILSTAFNKKNSTGIAINHAEILAIIDANKFVGDWRLNGCVMYVTLKPCDMCMAAIKESRIERVVYASEGLYKMKKFSCECVNNQPIIDESTKLLKKFFLERR